MGSADNKELMPPKMYPSRAHGGYLQALHHLLKGG
jgi:hypothetical protein